MGLASGGGDNDKEKGIGAGIIFGALLGLFVSRNDDDDLSIGIVGRIVICGGIVLSAVTIGKFYIDEKKRDKAAKDELNSTVAEDIQIQKCNVTYFDWIKDNSDYFFVFTGSGVNMDGNKLDVFSAKYKVQKEEYDKILNYIKKEDIDDLDEDRFLLQKIVKVLNNAELVDSSTTEASNSKATDNDTKNNKIILNVSKAKIEGNYVSYYVVHMEECIRDGKFGIVKKVSQVSYPKTAELEANPSKVFALSNDLAKVKIIKQKYIEIPQYDIVNFQQDTDCMSM